MRAATPGAAAARPLVDRFSGQFGIGPASQVPRLMWVIALGGIISSTGMAFVWPLTTIYVHFVLGKPLHVAGLVLAMQAGSNLLGQIAGGRLFDRLGGKPVIVGGLLTACTMLTIIGLVHVWPVYLAALAVLGLSYGMVEPATNALIAQVWPAGGRKGFNLVYVARNAGVAIGTALGGVVAAYSFTLSFLCNAAAALSYAVLVVRRIPRALAKVEPILEASAAEPSIHRIQGLAPVRIALGLGFVCLGTALNWLAYTQWHAVVSVYMRGLGYSLAAYSGLWTINGAVIVLGQPLVSSVVRRRFTSLRAQITVGSLLFGLAFALISHWTWYQGFAIGMVVLTLGEMLVLPALPAAAASLAAPGVLGLYQGMLGGAACAGRMAGPILGGALYGRLTPPGVLAGAAAVCATAAGAYWMYGWVVKKGIAGY